MAERPLTILCVSSYEKGQEFLRTCKRIGCRVLLLTVEKLRNADWPRSYLWRPPRIHGSCSRSLAIKAALPSFRHRHEENSRGGRALAMARSAWRRSILLSIGTLYSG